MTTNQLSSARPTRMLHRHRQPAHRCKPTASRIPVTVHRASQGTSTTTTSPDFSAREHASSTATPPNVATAAATPASVFAELLADKRQNGLTQTYLHTLQVRLGKFAADFKTPLHTITTGALSAWLTAIPGSPRTRRNYRSDLAALFQFAKDRHYIPKTWDELPRPARAMASTTPIGIYTPDELAALLDAAAQGRFKHSLVPLLALGAFAGIRTGEILRLQWEDIGPEWITVKSKRTRTASRRLVPVLPTLSRWLALDHPATGPVCPYRRIEVALARLAGGAKVKWKHNGLRHSFISYRVAQVQSVAQVALECGNSPAMIFQHYRELVQPQQAQEWFAICHHNVTTKPAKLTKPR